LKAGSLEIPERVRARAAESGDTGAAWLAGLQDVVLELAGQWGLSIGRTFSRGTEAFVAAVTFSTGRPAVLKIAPPWCDAVSSQLNILKAAHGRGYSELYQYDEYHRALLLERLGPPLGDIGMRDFRKLEIICATLEEAWMPALRNSGFATGADKAARLCDFIEAAWLDLGRPCSERTIERVRRFVELRRGVFDWDQAVLAHGDSHPWNALQSRDDPKRFKFIDPDGLVAEKAYDLGIQMREWVADGRHSRAPRDLLSPGIKRCRKLAHLSGVDAEAIWQWGLIERTSTGLHFAKHGVHESSEMLTVADAWATADGPD